MLLINREFRTLSALARRCFPLAAALALAVISGVPLLRAAGQPEILPLDQVKPGMKGEAYTIFAGDQVEKFDLEVIGILPNLLGPRQSVILVQLHGDKVEHTGVVAGMSGSPVYIDGKLVGALSLKFGIFNKEPLAGVTPIEDMLGLPTGDDPAGSKAAGTVPNRASLDKSDSSADAHRERAPRPARQLTGIAPRYPLPDQWQQAAGLPRGAFLEPIAAPLVFSGFAPATIRQYSAEWAAYGMVAAAGGTAEPEPDDAKIVPGDMVGMVLVRRRSFHERRLHGNRDRRRPRLRLRPSALRSGREPACLWRAAAC